MSEHGVPDRTEPFRLEDHLRRRKISPEDILRYQSHMAEIFAALGMEMGTPATKDTPRRFLEALIESTDGYEGDPKLLTVFATECRGGPDCKLSQVIEGPIRFYGLCEHHALPFTGQAYIAYIPHEHIIGISKLTRLVRLFAKRFAVQERIGQQIADTMDAMLKPHGVGIYMEARHLCVEMRGVKESGHLTRATYWRGEYEANAELRAEFLNTCRSLTAV